MTALHRLLAALLVVASPVRADVRLLMVEQPGCTYCAEWNAEVGDAYDRTAEGRVAPLLRTPLAGPLPAGVTLKAAPVFTPTFVLLDDGIEVGRIEGYPGESFFWELLAQLLDRLPDEEAGS